jgi:hypothetical protein
MAELSSSRFVTGGTLRADHSCYLERAGDRRLLDGLSAGEFCYVLTARQMGKSSLMVRTTQKLRDRGCEAAILDLTSLGQNLTCEQWYDGLLLRLGQQLQIEPALDAFWRSQERLGPCLRFFSALREVVIPHFTHGPALSPSTPGNASSARPSVANLGVSRPGDRRLVVFIDEIDVVRSLPFSTDEFFAAIRGCYNQRSQDPLFEGLTFCLLGVATPAELMRDPRTTPFNLGRRVELSDFTIDQALPLAQWLAPNQPPDCAYALLERTLFWTHGHPYLTQRLCRALAQHVETHGVSGSPARLTDETCDRLFLSPRARETDDNLLYVRERLCRTESDLASLLELYEEILAGRPVPDDDLNELTNQLLLAGVVRVEQRHLVVRNRIYERIFDSQWIAATKPVAELQISDGRKVRLRGASSLGRTEANDVALPDAKVSRRHAVIHRQGPSELWLADLGSRNGTFLNGTKILVPTLLSDQDRIEIGPYRLIFRQPNVPRRQSNQGTTIDRTVFEG